MGGFISSFSSPHAAPVVVPAAAPVADSAKAAEEARLQREEAIARNRRGRAGMVVTSDRGVLSQPPAGAKSLLGE